MVRIGHGMDVHRFLHGRPLVLGGRQIPSERGLEGHSDADVLLHAVIDAILGALALRDIGQWFPDSDPRWRGSDSGMLLRRVLESPACAQWHIVNVDTTVVIQSPKLSPYIDDMIANVAGLLQTTEQSVSIKATTSEGLGFTGRGEGVAAYAVILLDRKGSA